MAAYIDPDVEKWSKDWRRLRHQKHRSRGGVEGSMLLDYLLYEGEHQSVQVQNAILTRAFRHERDKNKLRLVINMCRKLTDRKIGRLWSIAHEFRATPNTRDPLAFDLADVVSDQLIPALDHKLGQDMVRWLIYKYVTVMGVCFEHVDYKEAVTQDVLPKYDESGGLLWKDALTGTEIPEQQVQLLLQSGRVSGERFTPAVEVQSVGEVGADIYDPFRVFVDASVGQIRNMGPGQRIFLADLRTEDWITDTFGSDAQNVIQPNADLSIIETRLMDRGIPVAGLNLKDLLPLIHGSKEKDDPNMAIVLTMYEYPSAKNPQGVRAFFTPDGACYDKAEIPFPEIPVIDYHWGAPGTTMWTSGFVRDFHSLSKFINKRFSQLGEAANAQIYEMLLLGEGLKAKDIPTDFPGVVEEGINSETGAPNVQVVPRGNIPSFFPDSIRLSMETLEGLGGSDLMSQRKFPGQLRGSLTVPMLQEIIDSEDGPRYSHWAFQFAVEKEMRINRVKQFYEPIRTMNYTGQDMRAEVLELHTDELLKAGVDFRITVDPGSILPELSAMREARIRERMQWAPGLYTNEDTGMLDWSKVADDLKYNDKQREGLESKGRKLARQLVGRVRKGQIIAVQGPPPPPGPPDPQTGQPAPPGPPMISLQNADGTPFIVYPFWPHAAMMDEYKNVMMTTEFMDGSQVYRRVMLTLHDKSRQVLAAIQQARQASVDNKMVQGAVAQATQQAAAQAASLAVKSSLEQVMAQGDNPVARDEFSQLQDQVRMLVGGGMAAGQPGIPQPPRPMLPPGRRLPVSGAPARG